KGEGAGGDGNEPRFELRKTQDIIEHPVQASCAGFDRPLELVGTVLQMGAVQEVDQADDSLDGIPDLMADVLEEIRLGGVRKRKLTGALLHQPVQPRGLSA